MAGAVLRRPSSQTQETEVGSSYRSPVEPMAWRERNGSRVTQLYDAGIEAHKAAEAHLGACWAAEYALEEGADIAEVDTPASAPFCGCTTCEVREVLHAAWPVFTADVVNTLRAAGFTDAADLIASEATARL